MNKVLIIICLLFINTLAFSQNSIQNALRAIEKNNTGLKAFSEQQQANRVLNKTGIFPHNPEFEFGYFYGNPIDKGNKINISLMQSFDFPTAYIYKSRIAEAKNQQLAPEFENYLRDLLLEAEWVCLELIYYNALISEYSKRLDHSGKIVEASEKMFMAGEISKVELNKAKLNHIDVKKEFELIEIKQNELKSKLAGYNGGIEIVLEDKVFETIEIVQDFDYWYVNVEKNNPFFQWLKEEIEISKMQEKLQKAMNLPSISAGYVSEALIHEQFRGFAVGVSIPLWENKNALKYAKANTSALHKAEEDAKTQYYNLLKNQYSQVVSLKNSVEEYRNILNSIESSELLYDAWKKGEIRLTNYLLELSDYYHSAEKILEMELDLQKSYSVLKQYSK